MPRPCCMRHVTCRPGANFFKPSGISMRALEVVILTLDELEALRLADLDGLYQEPAAEQMKISRPTFARIVEQARRKTADALIHGKALRLEGGTVTIKGEADMPNKGGTGPVGSGIGQGRGPCGCGQRHRGPGGRGAGPGGGRRGMRCGGATMGAPTPAGEPAGKDDAKKGEKE
jgi:predicted DNA-binding protein (UPF0251 family)